MKIKSIMIISPHHRSIKWYKETYLRAFIRLLMTPNLTYQTIRKNWPEYKDKIIGTMLEDEIWKEFINTHKINTRPDLYIIIKFIRGRSITPNWVENNTLNYPNISGNHEEIFELCEKLRLIYKATGNLCNITRIYINIPNDWKWEFTKLPYNQFKDDYKDALEKREIRRLSLIDALKLYKLKLRSDSKLCMQYIDNKLVDWSLDQVVRRMCEMKYLYDYCDMNLFCRQVFRSEYSMHKSNLEKLAEAEEKALKRYGPYPNQWPWIEPIS